MIFEILAGVAIILSGFTLWRTLRKEKEVKEMTQAFDNLKASIDSALVIIAIAVERIQTADSPTALQAEVDRLNQAMNDLAVSLSF